MIVTPETVLRWRRRRFREYWTMLSGRPAVGRPPVDAQIKGLSYEWPPRILSGAPREPMVSS
jgi:hypothetical protein